MNDFIKQQQELARKDLLREFGHDETLRLWVEHRIEKTITDTGKELLRLLNKGKVYQFEDDDGGLVDFDTLKKHITSVTGVE